MFHLREWLRSAALSTAALVLAISPLAIAEDVEIFSTEQVASEPNILMILDNSGSMTNLIEGTSQTRMQALTAAFQSFVSNPDIKDVNIGLMAFSNGNSHPRPHGVSVPVSPIDAEITPVMLSNLIPASASTGDNVGFFSLDDDNLPNPTATQTVRQYLPDVIGAWTASGGTPIVDAFHEAALYFKGLSPKWGAATAEQVNAAHPSTYTGQYLATKVTELTGGTRTCSGPTCGLNCLPITTQRDCAVGETSCYTGTNCTTETRSYTDRCNLGSSAECMLSNPDYAACEAKTDSDCSSTCTGSTDPENGVCLGEVVMSCSDSTYFDCSYTQPITSCDENRYQCDQTKESLVTSGSAVYNSPLNHECQSNTIILLSDGSPNASYDQSEADSVREEVKTLIGRTEDCAAVTGQVLPVTDYNTLADGRCGPELAEHLATVDQSSAVAGENLVKTYTVGFAVDDRPEAKAYLESLALSGDGKYFPANDSAALAAAFTSILNDTLASAKSFAAPVYTVDTDSLLSHSDDIYLPLFQNTDFPAWRGNLKKFKLNADGVIVDTSGNAAFDSSGQLRADAVDFWMPAGSTGSPDADPITDGGFANNVTPVSRKVFTDNGASLLALNDANVSKAQLGDTSLSDAQKALYLNYIRGYEDDGVTPRQAIGDVLHSNPTFISYGDNQKVLFFGTNEGYLHAMDANDAADGGGDELFAFMPSSLLKNIPGMHENAVMPGDGLSRIYGVDGSISAFVVDKDSDGNVEAGDGDSVTIIFGLRRGGSEYYALDVTNPDSPTLKWKISATGDYARLGETWSQPKAVKLRYLKGGTPVLADVLVFGGGYDNRLDEQSPGARTSLATTQGNAVYIADLETGELIWSASGGQLQHSVPGDIRTLDMNGDGSIDRLYFGDTGGNLWRADLNAFDNEDGRTPYDVKNNALLTHFASLGGTGADARKFFYEPEVSLFRSGVEPVLLIAIGSGYRSHPLNENISDRFYVISDENVLSVPDSSDPVLTDSDLLPVGALTGDNFFPGNKGWYKDLTTGAGEKVLASPLIYLSKVSFTTFAVGDESLTQVDEHTGCVVQGSNIASVYVLDLMTGTAIADLNGDGTIDSDDESVVVPNGNILDTPQLVFNEPTDCDSEGCSQFVDLRIGNMVTPLIDKDTAGAGNDLGDLLPKVYWLDNQ